MLFNSGESAGENKPPKWTAHAGQAPGVSLFDFGPAWLPSLVVLACKLFRDLEFGSSSFTFSRPISSYSASLAASPFRPLRPSTKSSGNCSSAHFLHFAIWMGCTLNCEPSWLSVFSPRIASIATRALNFGLYCFLVVVIDLSSSTTPPNLTLLPGLKSGDHYSPWLSAT